MIGLALSLCCCSTKQEQVREVMEWEKDVVNYFAGYLNGETSGCGVNESFNVEELESYRQGVWESWKEANLSSSEEKLIPLAELNSGKRGSWQLPANLEPNAVMPYFFGKKGTEKPDEGYPFFLYLHGSGPKASEWATGLQLAKRFDDAPSIYFIPQIPNEGAYYRWWQKAKQYAWEKLLRQMFISGEIDPNRIYFFGISEGGYGSQRLASFYADYLAAAGPMAGGEPLENAPVENCSNIAFSLRTGDQDTGFSRNTMTQTAKDEFDRLEQLYPGRFKHWIELIPGYGHSIPYDPTTPWLKQHTRNPHPKNFMWEDYAMDGLHRKGFYNLYVLDRGTSDVNARIYYEMNISGNEIDVKVDNLEYEVVEREPQWNLATKTLKHHTPATQGKLLVYLSPELVDMQKPVTLKVNGKQVFSAKVEPNLKHLVNSCAAFFDPERIYPAAIEVDLANL